MSDKMLLEDPEDVARVLALPDATDSGYTRKVAEWSPDTANIGPNFQWPLTAKATLIESMDPRNPSYLALEFIVNTCAVSVVREFSTDNTEGRDAFTKMTEGIRSLGTQANRLFGVNRLPSVTESVAEPQEEVQPAAEPVDPEAVTVGEGGVVVPNEVNHPSDPEPTPTPSPTPEASPEPLAPDEVSPENTGSRDTQILSDETPSDEDHAG